MSRESADKERAQAANGPRARKSYYLTEAVAEKANSAVHALKRIQPAEGEYIPDSASALVEWALWQAIAQLEEDCNGGQPFARSLKPLPTGPAASGSERLSRPRGPYYPT